MRVLYELLVVQTNGKHNLQAEICIALSVTKIPISCK